MTHPDKLYFSKQVKVSKFDLVRYYLSIAPGALAGIRRPADCTEALRGWRGRRGLLSRSARRPAAALAANGYAVIPVGTHCGGSCRRRCSRPGVDRQSGCIELHPHPGALRGSRTSGRIARRSRSRPGRRVGKRASGRAGGEGAARRVGAARVAEDQRLARDARERAYPTPLDVREVRRAAVALSRAVERRVPALASSKWWKEERHGVFLDYNQNAKDRTTCSAYSVRPLPDARVSTPLDWHEVPTASRPTSPSSRFPSASRRWAIRTRAWTTRRVHSNNCWNWQRRTKLMVWPTRRGRRTFARWRVKRREWRLRERNPGSIEDSPRTKMPLLVVANSPDKEAALAGLERWKSKYPEAAKLLAVDDVLVDSMRGRSSTWTRIRVNLRHVPEELRPPQETPEPDDDPTREWRERWAKRASKKEA